ncbi:MAG: cell division protein FtsL [Treponema sp.]|jgi:cell division protein FtsL|nr:cell division protein FtsL [Treponema sp.]
MSRRILLYVLTLTIPLCLGAAAWQSAKYTELVWEIEKLESLQEEWVENNKRLIAGMALLSSPERIENIAKKDLNLIKKLPEDVLQIRIEGGPGGDG